MNKFKLYIILILLVIFSSCGFKIENNSKLSNFGISEIEGEGDPRINYKLKNGLSFITSRDSEQLLDLKIKTNKSKTIKEKNIKNEITKYKIDISVDVIFNKVGSAKQKSFTISRSSSYDVATQYSQTLTNEKREIEMLTDEITKDIFDKLIREVNDL
tara:strand:- start:66 stop:539 length:474 start_codon:yes stop_codon:yes gene_type:complete